MSWRAPLVATCFAALWLVQSEARAERASVIVDPTEGPCHDHALDREGVRHPVLHAGLCRGFTANAFFGLVGEARPFTYGASNASAAERIGGGGELGLSLTYSSSARFALGPLVSARVSGAADAGREGVPHVDAGVRLGVHALFTNRVSPQSSYWDLVLAAEGHANDVASCGALYGRVGYDLPIDAAPVRGGVTETWLLLGGWLSAPVVCRAESTSGGSAARAKEIRFGALVALAWRAQ